MTPRLKTGVFSFMRNKIEHIIKRFTTDLYNAIAHEMVNVVTNSLGEVVTGLSKKPKPKQRKPTPNKVQYHRDYNKAWRLSKKLKDGEELSSADQKWLDNWKAKRPKK